MEAVKSFFGGKTKDFITAVDERSIIIVKQLEDGEGYSDILIETENSETAILIEVKYAGDGNLDVACERALKQVEERKYDEELRENGVDKILKYGIACYMKRCKVKLAEESYIET